MDSEDITPTLSPWQLRYFLLSDNGILMSFDAESIHDDLFDIQGLTAWINLRTVAPSIDEERDRESVFEEGFTVRTATPDELNIRKPPSSYALRISIRSLSVDWVVFARTEAQQEQWLRSLSRFQRGTKEYERERKRTSRDHDREREDVTS